MKKTYVLDTNVLINDPYAFSSFEDNDVVIPMIVIEELDKLKSRPDIGHGARQASRNLDDLRDKGNLKVGVELPAGGTLRVVSIDSKSMSLMPIELRETSNYDNYLIAVAKCLSNDSSVVQPVVVVSKDTNVRIKCDALSIKSQDYLKTRVSTEGKDFYTGVAVFKDSKWKEFIDSVYTTTSSDMSVTFQIPEDMTIEKSLYPNQIVMIKDEFQSSLVMRVVEKDGCKLFKRVPDIKSVLGLKPRNKEQNFSLHLLLDPEVKLMTLTGNAGTGKTCLALAAGLEQLKGFGSFGLYERLVVTRPVQPVGKDLGYLPGTLQEKMDPWITPIKDNLNFLVGYKKVAQNNNLRRRMSDDRNDKNADVEPYLSLLMRSGKIEVEAIPYIRGRSIPGAYLIIDEAQNLTVHELKTIITRSGEGTKVILTGDTFQIDRTCIDMYTNGLSHAVEKFKYQNIAGHVTLIRGERSELATIASQIL